MPARLEAQDQKAETIAPAWKPQGEIKKPLPFEDELKEKAERLNALYGRLNLNEKIASVMDTEQSRQKNNPKKMCKSGRR